MSRQSLGIWEENMSYRNQPAGGANKEGHVMGVDIFPDLLFSWSSIDSVNDASDQQRKQINQYSKINHAQATPPHDNSARQAPPPHNNSARQAPPPTITVLASPAPKQ